MAILYDTYFVVALAFVIFFAILYRYNVHVFLLSALDARADRIRSELEEARRLREEAQVLLASFEQRQKEIEAEAAAMVGRARDDAKAAAEVLKREALEAVDRRRKAAEDQLAAAEAAAVREVKDQAVRVAVAAATQVLRDKVDSATVDRTVDDSIALVGQRLN